MSMQKGIQTVIMFGVLVVVVIILGILGQSLRGSQTTTTDPSYVIADAGLNATANTASQLKTSGTIVGIFILVIIAVAMLGLLVGLIKKFSGGKKNKGY